MSFFLLYSFIFYRFSIERDTAVADGFFKKDLKNIFISEVGRNELLS